MPFLTVLHKIRTQSGTPACSPTATAEMLSHTALRRWMGWMKGGNQSAGRRTLKCTQPTRPKVLLLLPTRWFYPLPLTSTHIRLECRNKQTKLRKVPPAPSGLRGGRHKALYTTTRETKQLIQNSIKQENIFWTSTCIFLKSSSLRTTLSAKGSSWEAGRACLGSPLTKSNYSESESHTEPEDRTTYLIGERRFQEEEPFYLITCQT